MRKILLCAILLFSLLSIQGQSKLVRGLIVDEGGEALIGVSVMVKGEGRGTITDLEGRYVLSNLNSTDTLQYSFIGYEDQDILVGAQTEIDVLMSADVEEIGEVQIVAFQKQKKESVIGSINTIKPAELKQPSSNLTVALAGRMAGVISYQRSGEPGADNAEFFIRGVTSFGYANSPLILLDGFEITSSDLARIEPDNIASFSIMKDATATSLYGARGANGVILVTTKEGREGKAKVSVRVETSIASPTKMNDFLGGVDYMELYNKAERTRYPSAILSYDKEKIENTRNGVNPYVYPDVDWYEELFNNTTVNTRANLNVTGGGNVAQYYIAASYTNENGLLKVDPHNNFNNNINIDRYNLRANININLTKSTKIAAKFYSLFNQYNGPSTSASDIFGGVVNANPVNFPKYYPKTADNDYLNHTLFGNKGNGGYPNPYADMVKGYKDEFSSTILSQFKLNQDLSMVTKGLSARAMASIKNYSNYGSSRSFDPFYYGIDSYDADNDTYSVYEIEEGTEYLKDPNTWTNANSRVYFELATIYNRDFGKHGVGGLLVYTQEERLNTTPGNDVYASLPARNMGIAGRSTYAYDSRYMFEVNFGYNGSERFAENHRWGFFPSAGIGWAMSNEKFWYNIKSKVNLFKLKATYGLVGNDAIAQDSERFLYLSNVNLDDGGKGYAWGDPAQPYYNGYTVNRYANNEVTWEIARKFNGGFEMGLFDKLTIQADYFKEYRSNIYLPNEYVPASMGLSSTISRNIGEAKSHGVDASADYNHSFNNGMWISGRANFTYATNEVTVNGEPDYPYDYMSKKGYSINQVWGLVAERLFVDELEVYNSPQQTYGNDYMAGDIKYVDVNDDGQIDDTDKVPIGYPTVPEIIYGFGVSSGYKGFDLSFFFQGSGRSSFFINPNDIAPFVDERNALSIVADNHWSDYNPDPYAFWPRLSTETVENNQQLSTWWLRDGRFLRLKSAEFGYTIPEHVTNKYKIKDLRLYVSGNNLFYISKFKLWDPEMGGNGLGYPPQRVINMGLTMSF